MIGFDCCCSGGGGGGSGYCGCAIPASVTWCGLFNGSYLDVNKLAMSQPTALTGAADASCLPLTLTWQSRPSDVTATAQIVDPTFTYPSLTMPPTSWWSTAFTTYTGSAIPGNSYLWMYVSGCNIFVFLVTPSSPYSQVWELGYAVANWATPTGNTCTPFHLPLVTAHNYSAISSEGGWRSPNTATMFGTHSGSDILTTSPGKAGAP